MSENLLIEPELVKFFLKEPIYIIQEEDSKINNILEKEEPQHDKIEKILVADTETFLPELKYDTLILLPVQKDKLSISAAEQLQKILKWLSLTEIDFLIENELDNNILKVSKTQKCISFGVDIGKAIAVTDFSKYKIIKSGKIDFVWADSLQELSENEEKKKMLLPPLKQLFGK